MTRQVFLWGLVTLFVLSAGNSRAEQLTPQARYQNCMSLIHTKPEKAFDDALAWKSLGGGDAAEHCIATALIGMKRYKNGADRLEKLADTTRRPKEFKAQILAQAAQGWFLGHELDRARAVLTTAIELDDTQADFYVDRAQIRAAQLSYKDALDDLNAAIGLNANHLDALVFRGTVHRLTENFEAAWSDISKATALDPNNGEALLERGMLYRIESKNDLARKDWLDAIDIDPNSPTAETARLNIEKMDVKSD